MLLKRQRATKTKRKNIRNIRNISETSKIAMKYVFSSPIIKGTHFHSFGRTVWETIFIFHKAVKNSKKIILKQQICGLKVPAWSNRPRLFHLSPPSPRTKDEKSRCPSTWCHSSDPLKDPK